MFAQTCRAFPALPTANCCTSLSDYSLSLHVYSWKQGIPPPVHSVGTRFLQAALHEEQQALQLLTPKVNMMTKSEHELGYCVAPPCCVASEEYKSDKARG